MVAPVRSDPAGRPLAAAALVALSLAACSGEKSSAPAGPGGPAQGVRVMLDPQGHVTSTVTTAGPAGLRATLFQGTTVTQDGATGPQVPAGEVYLSVRESTSQVALPNGFVPVAKFRVVLTAGGAEREASFWPPEPATSSLTGWADAGLLVEIPLDASVGAGTQGLLFDVTAGSALPVGSSTTFQSGSGGAGGATAARARAVAAAAAGAGMRFNPARTGSYTGTTYTGTSGEAVPQGLYWVSYTMPDPGCLDVAGARLCGPVTVPIVNVTDESSGDQLAGCIFGASNVARGGGLTPYWCERSFDAGTGATTFKISSQYGNLPVLGAKVDSSDGVPMWNPYRVAPSGGLHTPEGAVLADPYEDRTLSFAGRKRLYFHMGADKTWGWWKAHGPDPVAAAGYTVTHQSYQTVGGGGHLGHFDVVDTLDGRKVIEEDVLAPLGWTRRTGPGETWGNKGTYEMGLVLEHLDVDEVAGVLTLTGRFGLASCDGVTVNFGASTLTPTVCEDQRVVAPIPASGGGPVSVSSGTARSNVVPLKEWRVTWTHVQRQQDCPGTGTAEWRMVFDLAIRADVHDIQLPAGTAGRRSRVPFGCERGSTARASVTGSMTITTGDVTTTNAYSGSSTVTQQIPAAEIISAPENYLVCEGYVDLDRPALVWAIVGQAIGPWDTMTTTVQLNTGPVVDTVTQDASVRGSTWYDPAFPDTALWPDTPGAPLTGAAAWRVPLDGTLSAVSGGHQAATHPTLPGCTTTMDHGAIAPSN